MVDMSKIEQLERAVEALSAEERATFREWFSSFDGAEWDREIAADAASGRLDAAADAAIQAHRAGRSRPL